MLDIFKLTPQEALMSKSTYVMDAVEAEIHAGLDHSYNGLNKFPIIATPQGKVGDYGVALHQFGKTLMQSPQSLAQEIANKFIYGNFITHFDAVDGYVNATLDADRFSTAVIGQVMEMKDNYGHENIGQGSHLIIDLSAPNIAKRMSVGHLRSTIIGDSLARIYKALGYRVTEDNHIGDSGTQFGHLMHAMDLWGDKEAIAKNPIEELSGLYVRVTEAGEQDEAVKDAGRAWAKKLEDGDPEAIERLNYMVIESLKGFDPIYDMLGFKPDLVRGESFYQQYLEATIAAVKAAGILKESKGALIVDMEDKNKGVAIIKKANGGSVYMTRDIATALHRQNEMHADGIIYVVGEDQKQYFQQLFEILKMMGEPIADKCVHVYFGMIRLPEGKMSTRKGRVVLLEDLIARAMDESRALIGGLTKLTTQDEIDAVVKATAIGGLKWNDLMSDAKRSIVFDWDKMLSSVGNSAPYVQYAHARAHSIVANSIDYDHREIMITDPIELDIAKQLAQFPAVVKAAGNDHNPSVIAQYTYELAQKYNRLYHDLSILTADDPKQGNTRVALSAATAQVIKNGLYLLGIEAPDKM